jgi:hypothetical protein
LKQTFPWKTREGFTPLTIVRSDILPSLKLKRALQGLYQILATGNKADAMLDEGFEMKQLDLYAHLLFSEGGIPLVHGEFIGRTDYTGHPQMTLHDGLALRAPLHYFLDNQKGRGLDRAGPMTDRAMVLVMMFVCWLF